jgi:CemA family
LSNRWTTQSFDFSSLSTCCTFNLARDSEPFHRSGFGWTAKHLGIPENREFNSLFIATFPVLIDTVFKYWIFRYLTGQSPSAVATFKTMNE